MDKFWLLGILAISSTLVGVVVQQVAIRVFSAKKETAKVLYSLSFTATLFALFIAGVPQAIIE